MCYIGKVGIVCERIDNTKSNNQEKILIDIKNKYDISEDINLYQYIQDVLNGKISKKSYHRLSSYISEKLAGDIESIVGFSVKTYKNDTFSVVPVSNDPRRYV